MLAALSGIAAISAHAAGLLLHDLILISLWALLLAGCAAWVILKIGDRLIAGAERLREGRRVAKLLDEWHDVGHTSIKIVDLVRLWLERAPDNPAIRQIRENTMLRTLKAAVRQDLIAPAAETPGEIDVNTFCEIKSAAEFFRTGKWLEVKKEEWQAAPRVTSTSKPIRFGRIRRNWITAHKDFWNGW
jgi:hypothetical protein